MFLFGTMTNMLWHDMNYLVFSMTCLDHEHFLSNLLRYLHSIHHHLCLHRLYYVTHMKHRISMKWYSIPATHLRLIVVLKAPPEQSRDKVDKNIVLEEKESRLRTSAEPRLNSCSIKRLSYQLIEF